ncbi:MAG: S-layer homology domain-containing protein [Firmicutes bacterium]|nr:S-layer homology domain-containing protein [Bacillota bacterium]
MKQRILSMLLVIVMVAGMMPAHVLATDPEVLWGTSADNLTGSGTLTEAIAAYASYIQLQRNIESDSSLSFNNSVTLDLNGNTLTVEVTRSGTVGVYVAGDLTVTDSSTDRNGSLTGAGAYNGIIAYGDINVSGGSLTGRSDCENEDLLGYGVYAVGGITVSGGELTGTANGKCGYGVLSEGSITVSGGSLTGRSYVSDDIVDIGVYAHDITVEDEGKIIATGKTAVDVVSEDSSSYTKQSETIDETTGFTTIVLVVKAAEPLTHSVKVSAVNANSGEALAGATMQILNAEGYVVGEWVSTTEAYETIGLESGVTYTLHATVAPEGYVIASDTTFTIGNDGKVRTTGSLTEDGILLAVFEPLNTVTTYPLWVGGEQITSEKLTINGGNGTATYEPASNTLTLNNYSYTGAGHGNAAINYVGSNTLKLVVTGENSVTYTGDGYGLQVSGSLEISGTGSLAAMGKRIGVYSTGSIIVEDGSLTGTSTGEYGYGVSAEGSITITGAGTLTGTGTTAVYIVNNTDSSYTKQSETTDAETDLTTVVLVAKTEAFDASVTTAGGETTDYTSITAAIEAAQENPGSTLTLLADISEDAEIYIESGSFTIDLNGKTWQSSGWVLLIGGNDTNITITDTSAEGTGKLLGTGGQNPAIALYDSAKLKIAGGTVEHNVSSYVIDVSYGGNTTQAELNVSGGRLVTNGYTAIYAAGASVTVTGGTIESNQKEFYYNNGLIDLSDHSDPAGIKIYNGIGAEVTLDENTIHLPEDYVMLDSRHNAVTTLAASEIYTVGAAPITQSVSISAVDLASGEALAGATMQILNAEGYVEEEWVSAAEAHTVTGLKIGEEYTLRATVAPDGYTVPTDKQFSIDEVGNVSSTGSLSADGVLMAEFAKTMVKISAIESGAGEAIEGAHMQIIDEDGRPVDEWVSTVDDEETTDVDESIHLVYSLKTGRVYTLHTEAAPAGYAIAPNTTFTIDENGNLVSTGSVTTDGVLLVEFDITVVQVSAVDTANGEGIADATMQIIDSMGNVVEEWVSATDVESTVDVDESVHIVTALNIGEEYTLRATAAPDGYIIAADTTFKIDEQGNITTTGSLTEDGVLLAVFEPSNPEITSVTFNSDSPAYDAATNTFTIDEEHPLIITVTGENLVGAKAWFAAANTQKQIVAYDSDSFENDTSGSSTVDLNTYRGLLKSMAYQGYQPENIAYIAARLKFSDLSVSDLIPLNVVEKTYEVELPTGDDVNVSTDQENPVKGDDVTITVTPEAGKEVDKVIVKDEDDNEITVTENEDGTYTYEQPAGDVTVTVELKNKTYAVTLIANGGIIRDGDVTEYTYGVGAKLPTDVTRSGYRFRGWYDNEDCTGSVITEINTTDTGDKTFYAKWTYNGGGGGGKSTDSVTAEKPQNGTISINPQSASKGSTVTVTITPDKGYTLETLIVVDKNGKEIELVNEGDGKYTFKMPASEVAVKATFMDDNTMLNFFVDVPVDTYYYDAVLWAVKEGITNGTSDTTFSPNNSCTRAQMVTFLWKASGSPEPVESTCPFMDVRADAYYAKAVLWAVEQGITAGTSENTFSPNAPCTRGQMATFLWKVCGTPVPVGGTNPFTDVIENAYYAKAVRWAYEQEITGGTSATTFGSNDPCTRAQMVTFLYRIFADKI